MLAGKTFLITGATGRLGCATVARLEALHATVFPLILPGYPPVPKRASWDARTSPLAVRDTGDLEKLPRPDYVINYHWLVDRGRSFTGQIVYELDRNVHRVSFLWAWLREKSFTRFVNISSVKVFGGANEGPVRADTEPRPSSPYGIAKVAAEKFLDAYFSKSGGSLIHVRLGSVACLFGHPSSLMSRLCASAFRQCRIRINAGHTTCLIHIDEAVDLIINAALTASERYYIVAMPPERNECIADEFERVSGLRLNADRVDCEPGEAEPVLVSNASMLETDWTRRMSLTSALQAIVDSYRRAHPIWCGASIDGACASL